MFERVQLALPSRRLLLIIAAIVIVLGNVALPTTTQAFAGGSGALGSPYQITTCTELQSMANNLSAYYVLNNDIDCSDTINWNSGLGFNPVSNSSTRFSGNFNGQNYTISGLYINRQSSDYNSLFGFTTTGAVVSNVNLNDVNITGRDYSGGAVAYAYAVAISNVHVTGTVATKGSTGVAGGVAARLSGSTARIYDSSMTGTITNLASFSGGIAGISESGAQIDRTYFSGTITTTNFRVGGIVGSHEPNASNFIKNSYARGSLSGSSSVGGVVGANYSLIQDSYSTATVSASSSRGGAVGSNSSTCTSVFWDTQTSGQATSACGTGKTTAQMKSAGTFTTTGTSGLSSPWDFAGNPNNDVGNNDYWDIDGTSNDGYPFLNWQSFNATPSTPSSLGSSSYTNGSADTDTTPTLSFTLADSDSADTISYRIQIDDSADFASPVVDYASALAAQGAASFTVGQAAGSGSYTVGSAGQTLTDGGYYWRVKATDNSTATSSYTTANSGAVAFKIDTAAPTAPGTAATTTPTSDNTPTWTWTAASDSTAGLAATPYTFEWSQSSSFASGVSTATSTANTFTHSSVLADGVWYVRVKAVDALGHESAYSPSASVTVDTTAPTVTGAPGTTSPTNDTTPTWTWTAASDTGTGLGTPPYTVEWSQSSSFASGVSTDTALSNSFTPSTPLTEGTWYFRVIASDALGASSAYSSTGSVVIDTTAPSISATVPTDNDVSLAVTTQLSLTFNESVVAGAGNIKIYRANDDALVETITANSSQVTGSGTNTLTITLAGALAYATEYYVLVEPTAITDVAGNAYAGLSSHTAWSFSTCNPPPVVPATPAAAPNTPVTPVPVHAVTTTVPVATTSEISDESTVATAEDSSGATILNDFAEYVQGSGKKMDLAVKQKVFFAVKSERHSATVLAVAPDSVTILLASTPRQITLKVGQSAQYDVNNDHVDDVFIALRGITNGVADLTFKQLAATPRPAIAIRSSTPESVHFSQWWWYAVGAALILLLARGIKKHFARP